MEDFKLQYTDKIQNLQNEYYTRYYRDSLGLPNYRVNVDSRLNEEVSDE